ncbi:MAG: carbon monoxide dehydrogenase, partial [Nonomuraea sp.]|nr:carbon monoxide dehydrogenase [Nonomuraea sp.]
IDRFADNLARLLSDPTVEPIVATEEQPQEEERHLSAVPSPEQDVRPAGTLRTSRTPDEEALDLLEIAGQPLLKRLAPIAGGIVVLSLLIWVIRRLMR